MNFIINLIWHSLQQVWLSFQHNWIYLLISVVVATLLKLVLDKDKVSAYLKRNQNGGVVASTIAAVVTPLCSCGTTAVILGMMASTMPWAPIVAFMVSSPLSSPEGVIYSAGLFGWPFSITYYLASIVLGLAGGWAAGFLDKRGLLKNQARFQEAFCACESSPQQNQPVLVLEPVAEFATAAQMCCPPMSSPVSQRCGCSSTDIGTNSVGSGEAKVEPKSALTAGIFLKEFLLGTRYLLLMFFGFAFIGYFLNGLIPQTWIISLFGEGNIYNVPLAATFGLPFYINSEASLPLIRTMLDSGMSQGAAIAFLIAGSGTSIGAITGALTIARWRVIALIVATLWVGAILTGMVYNWLLTLAIF